VIVAAALAVTLFANAGSGCCAIPWHGSPAAANAVDKVTTLHVDGMTCGACATAVKQVLKKVEGVKEARVSYEEKSAVVTYDAAKVTPEKIAHAITEKLPTYCFGHSPGTIRGEAERTGSSGASKRITAEVKAGHCACEVKNPSGTCCLGDVANVEKEVRRWLDERERALAKPGDADQRLARVTKAAAPLKS
jgi:copper chaperone CopZ